jgi:hypothetical protein
MLTGSGGILLWFIFPSWELYIDHKILLYYICIIKSSGFEWDVKKEQENISKHGVSFIDAQYAFNDKRRIILKDINHH